jgi:hypothetical protein
MLDKALGDDLRHDLVGVVDALATLEAERKGERVGKVGWIGGREPVSMHGGRIAERTERNKNMLRGLRPTRNAAGREARHEGKVGGLSNGSCAM